MARSFSCLLVMQKCRVNLSYAVYLTNAQSSCGSSSLISICFTYCIDTTRVFRISFGSFPIIAYCCRYIPQLRSKSKGLANLNSFELYRFPTMLNLVQTLNLLISLNKSLRISFLCRNSLLASFLLHRYKTLVDFVLAAMFSRGM